MNKILLAVLIGGVVFVGGYFYFGGEKGGVVKDTTSEEVAQQPEGKKMAFTQFVNQGGAYKCTVNQSVSGTDTTGVVFIDAGLMRGTFETESQGAKVSTNILVRDGYTYTWSSNMPQGIKMAIKKDEAVANANVGTSGTYAWNAEEVGDYDCIAWNADQATFTLPAGIVFMDLADLGSMYKK